MNSRLAAVWRLSSQPVVRNVFYLFMVQAATLLVPLVTLPWVLRALQPAAFGTFALYQSIAQYFVIFVDFGFYLTATRRVAELGEDVDARSSYFWTVQVAKAILAAASVMIALAIWLILPAIHANGLLFFASVATIIGTVLTPMWLFAGLQRMGLVSASTIGARVAMIVPILLLVRTPADAWVAALVNSVGSTLAGLIAIGLTRANRLVAGIHRPSWIEIAAVYRDAWHLFLSTGATSLYAAANPVLLGIVSNHVQVGLFSAADRIRAISLGPISPLSNAFYPYISQAMSANRERGLRLSWLVLAALSGLMLIAAVALFVLAPLIVQVMMGPQFTGSVPVLRIMALAPLMVGINTGLGTLTMLPLGLKRQYSAILLCCGFTNLFLLGVLGSFFGAIGAAIALVLTEMAVVLSMTAVLVRNGHRARPDMVENRAS